MAQVATARSARARPPANRATARTQRPRVLVGAAVVVALVAVAAVLFRPGEPAAGAPIATLHTPDFHALAFSPHESGVVLFGHHNGVLRSADGGYTWHPLVERRNFDAMGLAVSPADAGTVYLAGHNIFQVSRDGGSTWEPLAHNLPGTDLHAFAMSPDSASQLYTFAVGQGVFRSEDGGRTWQPLAGTLPPDVTALAAAGGHPETLYVASARTGLLRSGDGGRTWTRLDGAAAMGPIFSLTIDPATRDTLYAGGQTGLYTSTDAGVTWERLPYPGENAIALALSPTEPGTLLAISVGQDRTGRVYRSDDGGQTWGARR